MTLSSIPAPVSAYITATNNFDIEALLATFAEDALVNDHRAEFATLEAIRNWVRARGLSNSLLCTTKQRPED